MSERDTTIIYGHNASPVPPNFRDWRASTALWTSDDFDFFMDKVGYDSMQFMPLRWSQLLSEIQQSPGNAQANLRNNGLPLIHSLHQTWRDETPGSLAGDVLAHPLQQRLGRLGRRVAAMALMERNLESIQTLQKIQHLLSPKRGLPVVLFPTTENGETVYGRRIFGQQLFQPTAEVWDVWNIHNVTELEAEMVEHGYNGLMLDLALLRQRFPQNRHCRKLPDWHELIPQLAPLIKGVQVSIDRSDLARTDPSLARVSLAEGQQLRSTDVADAQAAEIMHMLQHTLAAVREAARCDEHNPFPVVVETPRHLSYDHVYIVSNVKAALDRVA